MATLKQQSNGPLYSNTVTGTLAVYGWAVTFGTARMGLGGLRPYPVPLRCPKCNSLPINGQCANFILFDVALLLPPTKEVVNAFARVCLSVSQSVCQSVCLLARLLKNACTDLDEMLRVNRGRDMDELINF